VIFLSGDPALIVGIVIALVIGITCHEFSHAFVADLLGDKRPRALGRVSLNPVRHIDPLGALFFVIAGFGWGRPVPVNVYALRSGRTGMAYVAGAGPVANLIVATIFALTFRIAALASIDPFAIDVLGWVVLMNIVLGLFNLLPIPPLDGYNLLLAFLPPRQVFVVQRYAQYGFIVLLLLVVFGNTTPGGGPLQWLFDLARGISQVLVGSA
jgi:Zn-dependent protease